MIKEIPESETGLLTALKSKQESIMFASPELMSLWWGETCNCLKDYMGEGPNEEWQYKVYSIFSTISADEIKRIINEKG
jgi:hypothetical protein